MKNIILSICCSVCFCLTGFSQTIPGAQIDSCHKAFQLIPGASVVYKDFTFKNSNAPKTYSPVCMDSILPIQAWFKFQTGPSNVSIYRVVMRRPNNRVQIFTGSCTNPNGIFCLKIPPVAGNYATPFLSLLPNTEYLVKVSFDFGNSPYGIGIQTITDRKVRSTATGGLIP